MSEATTTTQEEPLQLRVGDTLQLQQVSGNDKNRYVGRLIGFVTGKSLLITTPTIKGKVMLVREGQMFHVRTLSGSNIYAFTATVVKNNLHPYPYLHLQYPKQVKVAKARNAMRVDCGMSVNLMNTAVKQEERKIHQAQLINLSTSGAQLASEERIANVDDEVLMALEFKVGNVFKSLKIPSIIRNVTTVVDEETEQTGVRYGVQFQISDPNDSLAIHAYVYQQIVLKG